MNYLDGIVDIAMSDDGDLILENGDLKLHSGIDWLISEIQKIAKTNNPEWSNHPNVGADLEDFVGRPNTRELGKSIEKRLYDRITEENIQIPGKLVVRAVPVSQNSISVYISITFDNEEQIPLTKIIYNYDKGVIQSTMIEDTYFSRIEEKTNRELPRNPYLNRL